MERLIERLWELAIFCSPSLLNLPHLTVEQPAKLTRFPLDAIGKKVLGEVDALELLGLSCVLIARPTTSMVERTPERIDLLTLELQDVDLATCGPGPILFIARKHPKSGPKPLAPR